MIRLDAKAVAECDHPECRSTQTVKLVLLASGGWGFRPESEAWQVGVSPQGVFVALCPEHTRAVLPAPAIPSRLLDVNGEPH